MGALALAIGAVGALIIAGLSRGPRAPGDASEMDLWPPTVAEVRANLASAAADGEIERIRRFDKMLTRRYRDQLLAVRVIVHPPSGIELRCGANISRRVMARIAVQTAENAADVFGRRFDVDIYETYVAAPKRKIGELRYPTSQGRPTVIFDNRRWSGTAR
jgi:hypothetical protein